MSVETKSRWSWKAWLARVALVLPDDAEAQEVAAKIAVSKYHSRRRIFWAPEFRWAWGADPATVDAALLRLSAAGLLSRRPGATLFAPTMEPDPYGADYRGGAT